MVILPILFSLLYAIKGGQHKRIKYMPDIDGTYLSSFFAGIVMFLYTQNVYMLPLFAVCWFVGNCLSIGEEIGGVGGYKGKWGPYVEANRTTKSIWRASLMRGTFLGACLAVATANPLVILISALLPVVSYCSISITQYFKQQSRVDWVVYEFVYGFLIGVAIYLY